MLQLCSLGRFELRTDPVSLLRGLRKLLAVLVYGIGISRRPGSDNSSEASSTPGWRTLGMSAEQLGRCLNMTRQVVIDLEKREAAQAVSLASLRKAADALECDVVMALVPRDSLENAVRQQARRKALEERNRLVHTMRLEGQESGVGEILDIDQSIASWLTTRCRQLWD